MLQLTVGDVQAMLGSHLDLASFLNAVTGKDYIDSAYQLVSSTKPYFDSLKSVLDDYLLDAEKKR